MYASTTPFQRSGNCTGMYREVAVTSSLDSASPHRLVTMLYEGLLESLAQARGAIRSHDIETKCRSLGRAGRIVEEGLAAGLDLASGGKLAADLKALYGYISLRLIHANLRDDGAAVDECYRLVETLREGWSGIADQTHAAPSVNA